MTGKRKSFAAVVSIVVLAAAGLWWMRSRGDGLAEKTIALQSSLFADDRAAPERRSCIAEVTRNVDHMDRDDVKRVHDAFMAEWRRLMTLAIERYFSAGEAERAALLDRDIDRLAIAEALWFATRPSSDGRPPGRGRAKQAKARSNGKKPSLSSQLAEAYRAALLARAGKRGTPVPEWLLGSR